MALSFPSSPTAGQTSTQNGRTYTFDGYAWNLSSNVAGHASTHASTGSDPVTPAAIGAQKAFTSGTAIPTGGSSGDIYLRYT
mgnify:CR=1 FL=1